MDIVSRLKQFMEYEKLPSSQFADRAGIPRPTLSQILSGRNKKISNELIGKLHAVFPNLNVLWLLFGDGSMLVDGNIQSSGAKGLSAASLFDVDNVDSSSTNDGQTDYMPHLSNVVETDLNRTASPSSSHAYPEDATVKLASYPANTGDGDRTPTLQASHPAAEGLISMVKESEDFVPYGNPRMVRDIPNDQSSFDGVYRSSTTAKPNQAQPDSLGIPVDRTKRVASIMVFYTDNSYETFHRSPQD